MAFRGMFCPTHMAPDLTAIGSHHPAAELWVRGVAKCQAGPHPVLRYLSTMGFNLQHKHVFRPGEQLDRGLWEPGWIGDRAWIWDGRHVGRHGPTRGSAQQDPMFLVSAQRSKSTWPGAPGTLATWNLQGGVRGAPRCVGCWESFWSSPPTNVGASIGFVEGNIFFAQCL